MIFSIPLWLLILFSVIVAFLLYKLFSSSKQSSHPPSPPGLPIIGNFHQLGALPHRSLRYMASRYGDVMLVKFGSVPTVVVSSAEAAEEVLKTHDASFSSRAPSVMADIILYGRRDIAFCPYGEHWRQVRKITVLHLLNPKRVQSLRHVMEDEMSSTMHKIRSAADGRVDITKLLKTHVNNIVCKVSLGRKYFDDEEGSKKYVNLVCESMNHLGVFPIGDYIPWLAWVDNVSGLLRRARSNSQELDILIEKVLDDHLQNQEETLASPPDAKDFIDILLSLQKEGSNCEGYSLSRETIKAIVLDMFAAGTHTTSTTMNWMMAELMRRPATMKKVQEEVRKSVENKTRITDEDVGRMVYFKAAIKETLRLHPPGALLVTREAMESSKVSGYDVPAKTRVIVNAWAIGRDPKYWDRADEFIPDRFIDNPLEVKGFDFRYIPFGGGRRSCPGMYFALGNMEVGLANLLYHFDWDMPEGMKREEMDMTEVAGVSVGRKSSLLLLATPHLF